MRKSIILSIILIFAISTTTSAQFNIKNKIKSRFEKKGKDIGKKKADEAKEKAEEEGKKKAEEELEKAETIGMEEAEKGLDKARVASEPGLQKAEEYNKIGEEYTLFGLGKAQEFTDNYEAGVASKNPEDYRRYAFESAIVEYQLEGSETGKKTIYIDRGGYKIAEYKTIKEKRKEEKTASIAIGADVIAIDFESQSAVKVHNPLAYLLSNPNHDWEETAENIYTKMGYKKVGNENVLGKTCDVWKHGRNQIWVWNGLTLKSDIKQAGIKILEEATSIKINTNVKNSFFEVPEGFEYESVEAGDMFPDFSEVNEMEDGYSEEEMDELLDEIENMTYSEYKAKVLEEDPDIDQEQIRQAYLLLRQQAKRRKK